MFSHIQQLTRFAHQRDLQNAENEIRRKQAAASRLANFISRLRYVVQNVTAQPEKILEKSEPGVQPPALARLKEERIFKAARSDMPAIPSLTSVEGYRELLVNKIRRY